MLSVLQWWSSLNVRSTWQYFCYHVLFVQRTLILCVSMLLVAYSTLFLDVCSLHRCRGCDSPLFASLSSFMPSRVI